MSKGEVRERERERERESRVGSVEARAHARAAIGRGRTFKEVDIFAVGAERVRRSTVEGRDEFHVRRERERRHVHAIIMRCRSAVFLV